ncbi:MAG TPA: strawberry notch C-terminal domain-containing protein, partial [Blastocatellia bacterium]|nr:strawberry notch C-terminal domain-containing protein [Blastocatellia bacterium]
MSPGFLNRLLALNVEDQNALFDYFADLFDQTVRHAKANGTFDEGVTDIKALSVKLANAPNVVHIDRITGAETTHYNLAVEMPTQLISFAEADEVRRRKSGAFFENKKKGSFIMATESGRHTDAGTGRSYQTFAVWRPEGARTDYIHEDDLNERYRVVMPRAVRDWWTRRHAELPPTQIEELHIIGGAIIPLWQRLKTTRDAQLKVVRVTTDDGQRIVGTKIATERVWQVLRALGICRTLSDPKQIFTAIKDEADQVTLAGSLLLRQGHLYGKPTIELLGANPQQFEQLREIGLINEQINWKQLFFVPTDEEKGTTIITELLACYPVIGSANTDETNEEQPADTELETELPASTSCVIELEQWVIEPEEITELKKIQEQNKAAELSMASEQ